MKRFTVLLALCAILAATAPAEAQRQGPTNYNNAQTDKPGASSSAVYRLVPIEIGKLLPGLVDLTGPDEPGQNPPGSDQASAGRAGPTFVDVPLPPTRPIAYRGRPILFDLPHDPTKVVVMFRPGQTSPEVVMRTVGTRAQLALELVDVRELALDNIVIALFSIPEGSDMGAVIAALRGVPGVIGAQPQYIYRDQAGTAAPADMTPLQYAPRKLNALTARASGDGRGVTIGLIDTGVDLSQPGLEGADITTFDVLPGKTVNDLNHGTALAGLMLADHGFDGIAPGAHLISIRAFDRGPDGAAVSGSYEIAAAVDLAFAEGVRVLNLSFAGPRDPLVLSVLDEAANRGLIFTAAAGNGGPQAPPAYPGAHRDAIAVTATDIKDRLFSAANRGAYIAVAAPGVDVLSPLPDDKFEMLSGTSIATAHVTAIVALMLERNPGLDRQRVIDILEGSAHDLGAPGRDAEFGAGLADAEAAVEAAAHQ